MLAVPSWCPLVGRQVWGRVSVAACVGRGETFKRGDLWAESFSSGPQACRTGEGPALGSQVLPSALVPDPPVCLLSSFQHPRCPRARHQNRRRDLDDNPV